MGRPTQHAFPLSPFFGGRATRVRYAIPEPHTPLSSGRGGGVAARDRVAAVIAAGTRPDLSFPNPEAKTASADGTAPARVWESRTPPSPTLRVGTRKHAPAHHTNRYDPTYQAARRKRGGSPDSVRPNHIKQQPDKAIYPPLASADCANRYEVRTRTLPYYAALARAQRRIAGVLHFPGIPKIAFWVCRLRPRPCKSARSPTSK